MIAVTCAIERFTLVLITCSISPPSGIGDLRRFWVSCLNPLVCLLTNTLKLFDFQQSIRNLPFYYYYCYLNRSDFWIFNKHIGREVAFSLWLNSPLSAITAVEFFNFSMCSNSYGNHTNMHKYMYANYHTFSHKSTVK
jgi:hypothetical protein